MSKKVAKKVGLGLAITGIIAGASALALAIMKKKKREEIYHEAELKAMNELDELMNENEEDSCCSDCDCSNENNNEQSEQSLEEVCEETDIDEEIISDEQIETYEPKQQD